MRITSMLRRIGSGNVYLRPYTYLTPSLGSAGKAMLILLVPQVAMLAITSSYASLAVVLATVLGSLAAEGLYNGIRRQFKVAWLNSLVQGIIIGMLLPAAYRPAAAGLVTLVALLAGKYAFGGFANAWANPAAITVAAAYILDMAAFPGFLVSAADVQSKNAALLLIQRGAVPLAGSDAAVTRFLNRTVFTMFDVTIPEGYVSLFWDSGASIPAFRFNAITLFSSIILISLDMVEATIPAVFLLAYGALVRLLGPQVVRGVPLQGDILLAMLTSGTLFSTLYVLQWYGTTPITTGGKVTYGLAAGTAAFLIIGFGTSPVGYMFMVLVMNAVSPLIQMAESRRTRKRIETVLVPRLQEVEDD